MLSAGAHMLVEARDMMYVDQGGCVETMKVTTHGAEQSDLPVHLRSRQQGLGKVCQQDPGLAHENFPSENLERLHFL